MPDPESPGVVRCHGAGCDRTLATVMQGPYDQAGREIRALVLARDVRKRAQGDYALVADRVRPEDGLDEGISGGVETVWAVVWHDCRACLAPRSVRVQLRCPSCGHTLRIDTHKWLGSLPGGSVSLLDVGDPTVAALAVARNSQRPRPLPSADGRGPRGPLRPPVAT